MTPSDAANTLSPAVELWLKLLADRFWCEIANHNIGAHHACQYASSDEANFAMLREAYLKGRSDVLEPPLDFDADVKTVAETNASAALIAQLQRENQGLREALVTMRELKEG